MNLGAQPRYEVRSLAAGRSPRLTSGGEAEAMIGGAEHSPHIRRRSRSGGPTTIQDRPTKHQHGAQLQKEMGGRWRRCRALASHLAAKPKRWSNNNPGLINERSIRGAAPKRNGRSLTAVQSTRLTSSGEAEAMEQPYKGRPTDHQQRAAKPKRWSSFAKS